MSDKLIEAVAKAICQSAMDENEVARKTPMAPLAFSRNTAGDQELWAIFETDAAAVLAAIEASGFVVVPKEPTEEMLSDADSAIPRFEPDVETKIRMMGVDGAKLAWDAMLAAAPKVTT